MHRRRVDSAPGLKVLRQACGGGEGEREELLVVRRGSVSQEGA